MSMDPVRTTQKIKADYHAYLRSILSVKNPEITRRISQAVDRAEFVRGPYLETTPPFEQGKSLMQLNAEGVISNGFRKISEDVHFSRPLYSHQEKAIRAIASEGKNVIVATGTGSGKTECYLLPIFNALMREKENGTLGDGVRALLLFPMNALANDQQKKLRQMLKNCPYITFGRYTGETLEYEKDAQSSYELKYGMHALPNEILSRERMRKTPPHILLTNYAMLEYLLLRPQDSEFFDGPNANHWRFIVIDEAHSYRGTNGSEIAMLLRRLKERIAHFSDKRPIAIATSATLGSLDQGEALVRFASNLFDEPFDMKSIITSQRVQPTELPSMHMYTLMEYRKLKKELDRLSEEEKPRTAFNGMLNDKRMIMLHRFLLSGTQNVKEVAETVFSDIVNPYERQEALTLLVEIAGIARQNENSSGMLSARYHLFVRSLEGMYISFYPATEVYLDHREHITVSGREVTVFEMANCQNCHQEYLIGKIVDGYLRQRSILDTPEYFLLEDQYSEQNFDADEDEGEDTGRLEKMVLCTCCGRVRAFQDKGTTCCDNPDSGKLKTVYRVAYDHKQDASNFCPKCGATGERVLKRFSTSNQGATFTIAESLYEMIPPHEIEGKKTGEEDYFRDDPFEDDSLGEEIVFSDECVSESGRKLLIFSDNRQEAAFFAGYMNNRHRVIMWQRMILRILQRNSCGMTLKELAEELMNEAETAGIPLDTDGDDRRGKLKNAMKIVLREFLSIERSTGLEGRGYIRFYPEKLNFALDKWGLKKEEVTLLFRFMLDTIRKSGAVIYPENISEKDEFFAPRNHPTYFRKEPGTYRGGAKILSLLPSEGRRNKRSVYIHKILDETGKEDPETVLKEISELITKNLLDKGFFQRFTINDQTVLKMDTAKWVVRYIPDGETVYRCRDCGRIFAYSIRGKCPEYRCKGTLTPVLAANVRSDPYYAGLYSSEKLLPMVGREHTAQLSRDAAGEYQKDFENGKINVLSCSTTFEMGVDVGELEATFLRNVPPETSNYIQRAGRAGRRASSTAFAVTFARRNSHDLNYFQQPEQIINGVIKPPYIETENDKVVVRHIHSVIFSWFFKHHPQYFKEGAGFFSGYGCTENAIQVLRRDLDKQPADLYDAVSYILPEALKKRMGLYDWKFCDELIREGGVLARTIDQRYAELMEITAIKRRIDEDNGYSGQYRHLINTLNKEGVVELLASSGVLPKYGFPVDVVKMSILNNESDAAKIDLSRDLRMAIGEYAPPSQIVANGYVWESYALNTVPNKGWPEHFYYRCKSGHIAFPEVDTYDETQLEDKKCFCGSEMKKHRYVVPIFGFSTSIDAKQKRVGEEKPQHSYTTRVQFRGIGELDSYQQQLRRTDQIKIGDRQITVEYSPNGEMVVMNCGKMGSGMWICRRCGYVSQIPQKTKHRTKMGQECKQVHLDNLALGHSYRTDILRIELPAHAFPTDKDQRSSVMYALLEGACDAIGISRDDIDGCIDMTTGNIILFDVAAGGAGHVKRVGDQFYTVLKSAMKRVDGKCGCSEETSCYGCLRNYGNQYIHDQLSRGIAYRYLAWLCGEE